MIRFATRRQTVMSPMSQSAGLSFEQRGKQTVLHDNLGTGRRRIPGVAGNPNTSLSRTRTNVEV